MQVYTSCYFQELKLRAEQAAPEICPLEYKMTIELWHEISNNVKYGTSKASDQPVHMHSLIRAIASCLNILWILSY